MDREQSCSLISKMSIREKIGQLNQEYVEGIDVEKFKQKIRAGNIGSVILDCFPTAGMMERFFLILV